MKEPYEIQIIRSGRKTIGIQITWDFRVIVRAPYKVTRTQVMEILRERSEWIEKNLERMRNLQIQRESGGEKLTEARIRDLSREASVRIPERVAHYALIMGVTYGKITIRHQKTRWGSCSGTGNLNFNCLLMLVPEQALDYVVVHELCHRKEMNHSPRFWKEVEAIFPEYREARKWLKDHGGSLICLLP